jgi:hypothetical protein
MIRLELKDNDKVEVEMKDAGYRDLLMLVSHAIYVMSEGNVFKGKEVAENIPDIVEKYFRFRSSVGSN